MRGIVAACVCALALAATPQQVWAKQGHNQQGAAAPTPPAPKKPATGTGEQRGTCPGTSKPNLPCEAVSAAADERQAVAAENQGTANWLNFYAGVVTALIAGLAAAFAKQAANAGMKGYQAFTEVESADLVVTLEDFGHAGDSIIFKPVAHNIGRSSALVMLVQSWWTDSPRYEEAAAHTPEKNYIVKAGDRVLLDFGGRRSALHMNQGRNFLWVEIGFRSPLRGVRIQRICFEVYGPNSNPPYVQRYEGFVPLRKPTLWQWITWHLGIA